MAMKWEWKIPSEPVAPTPKKPSRPRQFRWVLPGFWTLLIVGLLLWWLWPRSAHRPGTTPPSAVTPALPQPATLAPPAPAVDLDELAQGVRSQIEATMRLDRVNMKDAGLSIRGAVLSEPDEGALAHVVRFVQRLQALDGVAAVHLESFRTSEEEGIPTRPFTLSLVAGAKPTQGVEEGPEVWAPRLLRLLTNTALNQEVGATARPFAVDRESMSVNMELSSTPEKVREVVAQLLSAAPCTELASPIVIDPANPPERIPVILTCNLRTSDQ